MQHDSPRHYQSTSRPAHIPALDSVRGFAVCSVIVFHCSAAYHPAYTALSPLLNTGWVGVDLFFALSGFLITGILMDARGEEPRPPEGYFRAFYTRRVLRIFPLYYAFLAVFTVASHFAPGRSLVWHAVYGQNILIARHGWDATNSPLLGHLWSLAVEEQFYLVWPFLIAAVRRRALPYLCCAVAVVSFVTRWYFLRQGNVVAAYVFPLARADALAAGSFMAWAFRSPGALRVVCRQRGVILGATAVVFLWIVARQDKSSASAYDPRMQTIGYTANAVAFALLVVTIAAGRRASPLTALWNNGLWRTIGRYSYAMYVFHPVVIELLRTKAWPAHGTIPVRWFGLFTLLTGVLTFGVAWCSWHLYERRWLRLKRYFEMPAAGAVPSVPAPPPTPIQLIGSMMPVPGGRLGVRGGSGVGVDVLPKN